MVHQFKKGEWVEFQPYFYSFKSKHGKVVGVSDITDLVKINAQGKYFDVPQVRILRKVPFTEVFFGG